MAKQSFKLVGEITFESGSDFYTIYMVNDKYHITSRKGLDTLGNGADGYKNISAAMKAVQQCVKQDEQELAREAK